MLFFIFFSSNISQYHATVEQRNYFTPNSTIEVFTPNETFNIKIDNICDNYEE